MMQPAARAEEGANTNKTDHSSPPRRVGKSARHNRLVCKLLQKTQRRREELRAGIGTSVATPGCVHDATKLAGVNDSQRRPPPAEKRPHGPRLPPRRERRPH